jgi:Glycosyl transferase family 2
MIKMLTARNFSLFWHPKFNKLKRRSARAKIHLQALQNHTSRIKLINRLLITAGKNENRRIPYFLEYYRNLDIDHFLFVDNMSDPLMADVLFGQPDISLWRTEQRYTDASPRAD